MLIQYPLFNYSMLRIIQLNLNGIRAAYRKGLGEWLSDINADIVCLQELKAQEKDITDAMQNPADLQGYFSYAQKPGYSGVGIYCRQSPSTNPDTNPDTTPHTITTHYNHPIIDSEGRFIRVDFPRFSVISLYMPSGSSGDARQMIKWQLMDTIFQRLQTYQEEAKQTQRQFIICGDINIAHTNKDICNWRGNQKNSGFLPEERQWISQLQEKEGWIDVFRQLNNNEGEYTWWSNRGRAWEKNVGWRIDYQFATPAIAATATATQIYKQQRFSDHAPLIIDYDYP